MLIRSLCAAAVLLLSAPALAQPVGTTFTFQGRLTNAGQPAAGSVDIQFRLFDLAAAGAQQGPTLCSNDIHPDTDGTFTVSLDFGPQFSTGSHFLEVSVRPDTGADCSNATGFTTLAPRQQVTPAPLAMTADNALSLGGQGASFYTNAANLTAGTIPDGRLSSNVFTLSSNQAVGGVKAFTNPGNSFNGVGSGLVGLNATSIASGTVADARLSTTVAKTNVSNTFSLAQTINGTLTTQGLLRFSNTSFDLNANTNTRILHADTFASDLPNLVFGSANNAILGSGTSGVTISGGGESNLADPLTANRVSDNGGTIGGGAGNRAGNFDVTITNATFATISGGDRNNALGGSSSIGGGSQNGTSGQFATVAGGQSNSAFTTHSVVAGGHGNQVNGVAGAVLGGDSNNALGVNSAVVGGANNTAGANGFVGGGGNNSASGVGFAAVAGGQNNLATGQFSAIPGGELNQATAAHTLAAGFQAQALHAGAFVWADSTNASFGSTAADQFLVRAAGGMGINTNTPGGTLHVRSTAVAATPSTSSTLVLERNSNNILTMLGSDAGERGIVFGSAADPNAGGIAYHNADGIIFRTGGVIDRMILDTTGRLGLGDTTPDAKLDVESTSTTAAIFNRNTTDGIVVEIQQAGITEGTISVAGTTVSFNAFTGSHFAWTAEAIDRSELVSFTGDNRIYHGRTDGEPLYGIARTAKANDPAVLGAYLALLEPTKPADDDNPHQIMAVGNGDMWVVDTGSNIKPGDYLISSDIPGCAMKDDPARFNIGHVVARSAQTIDWSKVTPSTDGHKRVRATVLFGNFVRTSEDRIKNLEDRLAAMEAIFGK